MGRGGVSPKGGLSSGTTTTEVNMLTYTEARDARAMAVELDCYFGKSVAGDWCVGSAEELYGAGVLAPARTIPASVPNAQLTKIFLEGLSELAIQELARPKEPAGCSCNKLREYPSFDECVAEGIKDISALDPDQAFRVIVDDGVVTPDK